MNLARLWLTVLILLTLAACGQTYHTTNNYFYGADDDQTTDDDIDDDADDDSTPPDDDTISPPDDDTTPPDDDTTPPFDDDADDDTIPPPDDDTTPPPDDDTDDDTTPPPDDDATPGGQVMEINGGFAENDYIDAYYPFADAANNPTFAFDYYPSSGAAGGFRIWSTDEGWFEMWYKVESDGELWGVDWRISDYVDCGPLIPDDWNHLEVDADNNAATYSVSVDGMVLTPCAALEMLTGSEVDQIEFVDYSDTGYGGIVYVDNIVGANNGSDIFNIDFESYALGPLPSPWTSYFQSGSSTINVVAF